MFMPKHEPRATQARNSTTGKNKCHLYLPYGKPALKKNQQSGKINTTYGACNYYVGR
jgi:hypothetical protein